MHEPRVSFVVPRQLDLPLSHRQSEQALAHRDLEVAEDRPNLLVRLARPECPADHPVAVDAVDQTAVGVEQARRLVDRVLQQLVGLADRCQAGGDTGQRPLGVHATCELLA